MKPTEETRTLILALERLHRLDLDKLFASAVDVAILDYTDEGNQHMPRVSLAAEDFDPVRKALIDCVAKQIARRKEYLMSQLRDLNSATYKYLGA